jgi:hypothetical protein
MKKILLILALLFAPAFAAEEKPTYPISPEQFEEYWAKYYVGMSYHEALQSNRPLILIFADNTDLFAMFKKAPLGDIIFKQFDGKYNCTVINVKWGIKNKRDMYLHKKDNPDYVFYTRLADEFHIDKYPAMFLVDPKERTYQAVPIEDITEEKLPTILYEYLEKCRI